MAFDHAVEQAKLVLGRGNEHEAEKDQLFKLLKYEEHKSRMQQSQFGARQNNHQCTHIFKSNETPAGSIECLSDHVLIKNLPPYDSKEAKYRPKER